MADELVKAGHALSFSQYVTLKELADGPCGATEIARAADLNPGAMTRLIDRLVELGLVKRVADPHDRRALQIHLTAQGQHIWREINCCGARIRERALAGVSTAEREQLVKLLERIQRNLVAPEA